MATYRIHPAIGIARLGNSPDAFYIAPEAPAAPPTACDADGNPVLSPDGQGEVPVERYKDAEGRVKRQAARFQVWVYDEESPGGRPLRMGDPVAGGGNQGKLVDIQWRVWLANKKASWYEFQQLEGEHGYAPGHPRRNADVTADEARQKLIIDPGPRTVNCTDTTAASFDRDGGDLYATVFPPPLHPCAIDTLGELKTDQPGRLLVLGGHGNSGSWKYQDFGQPRIDDYANNDGWFDDTSDGPVMARLVMYMDEVKGNRYIDVEYPAWVVCGYPRYVPEILDMVTLEDVVEDLSIREFATRTDLYGTSGTFACPQTVDVNDPGALEMWRAGRLQWNPDHRPWFYRDVWPILFRPDEFSYLSDILGLSNFPHNQSTRGTFDPDKLSVPPVVTEEPLRRCEARAVERFRAGELFVEALEPVLELLGKEARAQLRGTDGAAPRLSRLLRAAVPAAANESGDVPGGDPKRELAAAVRAWVRAVEAAARAHPPHAAPPGAGEGAYETTDALAGAGTTAQPRASAEASEPRHAGVEEADAAAAAPEAGVEGDRPLPGGIDAYLAALRQLGGQADVKRAADALEDRVREILEIPVDEVEDEEEKGDAARASDDLNQHLRTAVAEQLNKLESGQLLLAARQRCIEANTFDPYRPYRRFLFELLRQPGEENRFFSGGNPDGRTHNLPLMPLLAGDNPISNTLPSKFLRLTDYQYFVLRQWMLGLFYNEKLEGWSDPNPWQPYAGWVNRTGRDLDRAVLSGILGGAFCPGGEVGWIMRNPAVYHEPYRLKADPAFYAFQETAANQSFGIGTEVSFTSYIGTSLSQDDDFARGLQPGDVTKHMSVPWQADFNECSTQDINVT
ncbi:MAG TPA: LodA/GoxA family CTQ-dependent oxidase, partial [Longimicrobium sp.]|nr:LodA/GoxA family CTQ-dependent oxidase [Longimicrobium sp.]